VDYTPWLDVGTDTGNPGFQGDFCTLNVDDDSPQTGATGRVQEGVNLTTCSTVVLGPGTYEEQVVIATSGLTLEGAGAGATTIRSPVTLTAFFTTSTNNYPVVFVNGATGVTVKDLTVDGAGRGNGNYRFIGIAYWNSGGAVLDCDVVSIRETPMTGTQHGVGIYSFNSTGGPYALEVGGTDVSDYQKNAMALSGTGVTVDVHDCTATGAGDVAFIAQNGIQVSYGAGGAVASVRARGATSGTGPAPVVARGAGASGGRTAAESLVRAAGGAGAISSRFCVFSGVRSPHPTRTAEPSSAAASQ
jgi:hypothetical protein